MRRALLILLRVILGGLFLYAGALKVFDPARFAISIENYRMLPPETVNLLAITLPWIEVLTGILLIMGVWVRPSALIITGMCGVFLIAIGQAVARHLDITCGCFGTVDARHVGWMSLAEDGVLFLMSAIVTWQARD